ncbi:hypothetical protein ACFVMC_26620 [Nocardia sp. NPDC127579]|uniref:hypothetical protein n=1 Tax=Nocardia sp. NPDC127579 TaxID=3345402 RepID=UPI003629EE0B
MEDSTGSFAIAELIRVLLDRRRDGLFVLVLLDAANRFDRVAGVDAEPVGQAADGGPVAARHRRNPVAVAEFCDLHRLVGLFERQVVTIGQP